MARRKNKKSFADNLDLLFEQRLVEDNAQDKPAMFDAKETSNAPKAKTKSKKSKRKSFSSNLDQLFKGSLDGIMAGDISPSKQKDLEKVGKKAVGIDLLIRRTTASTVENKTIAPKPLTKRVTVVLDTSKIETLKRIAKEQKRPLRKLMAELVENFLDTEN